MGLSAQWMDRMTRGHGPLVDKVKPMVADLRAGGHAEADLDDAFTVCSKTYGYPDQSEMDAFFDCVDEELPAAAVVPAPAPVPVAPAASYYQRYRQRMTRVSGARRRKVDERFARLDAAAASVAALDKAFLHCHTTLGYPSFQQLDAFFDCVEQQVGIESIQPDTPTPVVPTTTDVEPAFVLRPEDDIFVLLDRHADAAQRVGAAMEVIPPHLSDTIINGCVQQILEGDGVSTERSAVIAFADCMEVEASQFVGGPEPTKGSNLTNVLIITGVGVAAVGVGYFFLRKK